MQLTFDADVEAFRMEFVAFLDHHRSPDAEASEFGGRNATLLQQYVHRQELARRRAYLTFNPQGLGIVSASLICCGTPEQQRRWAVRILRAEMTASSGTASW